jgi:hypothetical protein
MMNYYSGPTNFFDPEPQGSLFAESLDGSIQIWEAESYENDSVTKITREMAEEIITRPGWAG